MTSFSIDLESKRVTVMGHISPVGVLESISKVKRAELWTCWTLHTSQYFKCCDTEDADSAARIRNESECYKLVSLSSSPFGNFFLIWYDDDDDDGNVVPHGIKMSNEFMWLWVMVYACMVLVMFMWWLNDIYLNFHLWFLS